MGLIARTACASLLGICLVTAPLTAGFAADGFNLEPTGPQAPGSNVAMSSQSSGPFSSGGDSASGTSLFFPGFVTLSLGRLISNDSVRNTFGSSYEDFNYSAAGSLSFGMQMGWYLTRSAIRNTYLMLGLFSTLSDINSVTYGSTTYSWPGTMRNRGFYLGYGAEWALLAGGAASSSSMINPYLGLNFALGYGWNKVRESGGSFSVSDKGTIARAEVYMKFALANRFYLVPTIVALSGPSGRLDQGLQTYAALRLLFQF